MEIIFFGIAILFAVIGLLVSANRKEAISNTTNALISSSGGSSFNTYVSHDGSQGISRSADGKSISIFRYGAPTNFHGKEIISAEILKDGATIVKTNRGSQIGGALVGAALLGPLGLLVGGVTGSKSNVEKVRSITLRVTLRNYYQSHIDIDFYRGNSVPANQVERQIRNAQDALSTIQSVIGSSI